jgi:hypothetical protein
MQERTYGLETRLIIDTHLHLYPCHDAERLLRALAGNLARLAPGAATAAALVDGAGCHGFDSLVARVGAGWPGVQVVKGTEDGCLEVRIAGAAEPLYLFAGRQVITSERLEVLALGTRAEFADGLPAGVTLARVAAAGAVPVLAWAPGKWFGARGETVRALVANQDAATLLVGDTSLRPIGWPTPGLMRTAMRAGIARVCGSDPLPVRGEERQAGRYATLCPGRLDRAAPVQSLRALLTALPDVTAKWKVAGRRSYPVAALLRLARHARARRRE